MAKKWQTTIYINVMWGRDTLPYASRTYFRPCAKNI